MRITNQITLLAALACWPAQVQGQVIVEPDTLDVSGEAPVYVPGPELSPSLEQLFFELLLPGESRTLFMDLANLGDGTIHLGPVLAPAAIQVGLAPQQLLPGQFVRFPVSFTQADLDTHRLQLALPWRAPLFGVVDTLVVSVLCIPQSPLLVVPPQVQWSHVFTGFRYTQRVSLKNRGRQAIFFSGRPELPPDMELTSLPPVLAPGKVTNLTVSWMPRTPDTLAAAIILPFQVDNIEGREHIFMAGVALSPIVLQTDTLSLGRIYAGSEYYPRVLLRNRSRQKVTLQLRLPTEPTGSSPAGADSLALLSLPDQVILQPKQQVELALRLLARRPGALAREVHYRQVVDDSYRDEGRSVPGITFTVTADVALPLAPAGDTLWFLDQPVMETTMLPVQVINRGLVPLDLQPYVTSGKATFSVPPLQLVVRPGGRLAIPLYFRPMEMVDFRDTLVISYEAAGLTQQARLVLAGRGLDRPLLRVGRLPDITRQEDFSGPVTVAGLGDIFHDPNHRVTYSYSHDFGPAVTVTVTEDERLTVATTPNYHGAGDVVVKAVNEIGQTVSDTFRLRITPVNDLPRLVMPLADLVIREDQTPLILGRLEHLFYDPDETLEPVTTSYHIYNTAGDNFVRLENRRGELLLSVKPDWFGSRSFVVTARDAADTSAAIFDLFQVTVVAVNDSPRVAPLPGLDLVEDRERFISWRSFITDVDDPPENLTLQFAAVGGGALPLTFRQTGLGTLITPARHWSGELFIRLTVTDLSGATGSSEFNLVVEPVDDPPGAFTLNGPLITEWAQRLIFAGEDTLLAFDWQPSANHDPGDQITYTWQLLGAARQQVLRERPAGFTSRLSINFDSTGVYFWTVLARDARGQITSGDTLPLMMESLRSPVEFVPQQLLLDIGPSYPNPFSERTRIQYIVPRYSQVVITIFDATGRKVRTLISERQYAGQYTIGWDGRDNQGSPVASGPYMAELRAANQTAHLKLVLVH